MPAVSSSGTQAATINTEHTLVSSTGATGGKTYYLIVQAPTAATYADITIIRAKREARGADDTVTVYEFTIRGGGSTLGFQSPFLPVPEGIAFAFTLEQVAGTGRTWSWSLETV